MSLPSSGCGFLRTSSHSSKAFQLMRWRLLVGYRVRGLIESASVTFSIWGTNRWNCFLSQSSGKQKTISTTHRFRSLFYSSAIFSSRHKKTKQNKTKKATLFFLDLILSFSSSLQFSVLLLLLVFVEKAGISLTIVSFVHCCCWSRDRSIRSVQRYVT